MRSTKKQAVITHTAQSRSDGGGRSHPNIDSIDHKSASILAWLDRSFTLSSACLLCSAFQVAGLAAPASAESRHTLPPLMFWCCAEFGGY